MIPPQSIHNADQLFAAAFNMLFTHQYAEAYSIFSILDKEIENVAVSFNLALCCVEADEMNQAMMYIEKAMMQSRKIMPSAITTNSVYDKLMNLQCNTDDYCMPMDKTYVLQFPINTEQRVLRLAVDIYCKMELWNKVHQTASIIKSKNYKNVITALEKAK